MGLFTNKKKGRAPHSWYPEILHWKEGDEVIARNVHPKNPLTKLIAFESGKLNLTYIYRGLTADGRIIVEEKDSGEYHKLLFYKFVKKAKNITLKGRMITHELDTSNEYMELMQEFQKAYTELETSDKPKLLD